MASSSAELVTEADRRIVVAAYNAFYYTEFQKAQKDDPDQRSWFDLYEGGVKLATGQQVVDPERAIPDWYQEDGSFDGFEFKVNGQEVRLREGIAYDFLASYGHNLSHLKILEDNSVPFRSICPDALYTPRINLEALFESEQRKAAGYVNDLFDDQWNFQIAELHLRRRRIVKLPVVGAPRDLMPTRAPHLSVVRSSNDLRG